MASPSSAKGSKKYLYFPLDSEAKSQEKEEGKQQELPKNLLDKLLKGIGREALKEKTPTLQELEQSLQGIMSSESQEMSESAQQNSSTSGSDGEEGQDSGMPLVRMLVQKGYLKDSPK